MTMDAITASKERARLWTELKPLLVRSLGRRAGLPFADCLGAVWFSGVTFTLENQREASAND